MSVGPGSFGVSNKVRGGVNVNPPSSFYMGFWPCQQADGDSDDEQVTDRSGNGAHATLGSLTSAEAWANAGYVSTTDEVNHHPQIPVASWTHRFSSGSLILFCYQQTLADGVNALRIFGNGISGAKSGFSVACASTGALQLNIVTSAGGSVFSSSTSTTPYSADTLHSWLVAYDYNNFSFSIYVDGVIRLTNNTAISSANLRLADGAVTAPTHIGGRPDGSATNLVVTKTKYVHALDLRGKGLPTNMSALAARLHYSPQLMLSDKDLIF